MVDDHSHNKPDDSEHASVMADPQSVMSGDAAIEAMKAYQREMADRLRTELAAQAPAASPPQRADDVASCPIPASVNNDHLPEIVQPKKQITDAAAKDFARLKKKYLTRVQAGDLRPEEEIAFMKAESAERARQRKLQEDAEADEDDSESLFVGQGELTAAMPDPPEWDSDDDGRPKKGSRKRKETSDHRDDDDVPRRPAKKAAGKPKKGRNIAGQLYSKDDLNAVLLQAGKSSKSRKQVKHPKTPKAKSTANKNAKAGSSLTNTSNWRTTDVFSAAAANEDLPDQPTFEAATRRDDAMKQLIASVPTESRDTAKCDKRALNEAIKHFTVQGTVTVGADGHWNLRGFRTPLKHYQVLGVSFMRQRETGEDEPLGGILADDMGLGKTVMSLANIVNGKQREKDKPKTTLIVASPALVDQWFSEIQEHCQRASENPRWGLSGVLQHRAGHKLDKVDVDTLQNASIILTTYSEVNHSYPRAVIPENLTTAKQKVDAWWRDFYEENKGLLHRLSFLRVVLDEAQQIKNHKSISSMACRALSAKHRWAVTATPVYNKLSEFYSIFKFLGEPNTGSYRLFKQNFAPGDPDSIERLNVFLRKLMVRRTHKDTLFGARLLNLPKPTEHNVALEFSWTEREIYEIVRTRMINNINKIAIREGPAGLQKKFSHIWTMILRLRQLCSHALLLQGTLLDILELEDYEKLNRLANSEEEINDEGVALLIHLKHVLASRSGFKTIEAPNGASITQTQINATGTVDIGAVDDAEDIGGIHGMSYRFKKYLQSLAKSNRWMEITERCICCGCRQKPVEPYIADCFHIYCLRCLQGLQHLAARRGHDSARCAECGNHYANAVPCEGLEELSRESATSSEGNADTSGKKKKKKGATEDDWINLPGEILPSAKTRAAKMQIMVWLKEDPNAKIIVYTQFLGMIRILEKVCQTERWEFCKYSGAQSQDARTKAIDTFGKDKKKSILLASLKAGGLGLNLTMANKVLLLDPWWNSAVESQAFARIYRIGQDKETELTRLIITNTIDEAMMSIKARKNEDIDAVMNDSKKKEALDVKDLMRLFGPLGEDGEGRPFIFAEKADGFDGEEPDHLRMAAVSDDEDADMGNDR